MYYCRYCGATLQDGARFCHICGNEVDTSLHCPGCGAALPDGSRFCSFCGTPIPAPAAPQMPPRPIQQQPQMPLQSQGVPQPMQQPVMAQNPIQPQPMQQPVQPVIQPGITPMGSGQTIQIPAPAAVAPAPAANIPAPDTKPVENALVPPVCNAHAFNGSVQRFFGENGSRYSFRGTGMYGFLEPFSMNYTDGQGPMEKSGGKWFFHAPGKSEGIEIPALNGAQILTSAPDGMYVYIAPTIYFVSPDGSMRPFIEADEVLTDMVCFKNWLFVTYLGPFEEASLENGGVMCCDRSYVIAYDRATGGPAAIIERCAGIYYIDDRIVILCDLMDTGEIRRNVYRVPVRYWTEEGFKAIANYVGRIRGSIAFSKLIMDTCGNKGVWKNPSECTTNLRCCDWKRKQLGFQQGESVIWRDFAGKPSSFGVTL